MLKRITILVAGLSLMAISAQAQDLGTRIQRLGDGTGHFAFTSRPGICGNGKGLINDRSRGMVRNQRDGWSETCTEGPIQVVVRVSNSRVTKLEAFVGGDGARGSAGTDLGRVSAPAAVDWLLTMAEAADDRPGSEAVFIATLADSVTPWPRLFGIARNQDVRRDTRRAAIFWLGQAAGDVATRGLADMAEDESEDDDIRSHAIFALSQMEDPAAVTALIRVAKTSPSAEARRKSIFWLGQSEDPRALDLFEDLLAKGR
jgi:hypothetical protein